MAKDTFFIFFVIWAVLGIGFAIVTYGPFDVRLKRLAWRVGTVLAAILFAGFIIWEGWPAPPWIILLILPVMVWLNWKGGRFCDACGAFQKRLWIAPWQSIRPPTHCIRCGTKIA